MSFDALTLTAVCDELAPLLTDCRIQRLAFPDEHSLALETFAPGVGRTYVLCSAHPEHARIQRLEHFPARGIERDLPWVLVARKHLRSARIRSLRQPRLERVLELDCEQRDDSGQHYQIRLIVEAMGRRSNLILVDHDGAILDAMRRTPPSRNPRRPVLPHQRYDSPPAQDRLPPEQLSAEVLADRARGKAGLLSSFLTDTIAGLSPQATRELTFRATGAPDTPLAAADWSALIDQVHALFEPLATHVWTPTVAWRERDEEPLGYAPYRLEHLAARGAELVELPTISAAMSAYYAVVAVSGRVRGDELAGERRALLATLEAQAATLARRVAALEQQLAAGSANREPLRRAGEMILTYQATLAPGAAELVIDGERVALDGQLSPSENAQAYFARYRKAREAEARVPELLENARNQTAHVADLHTLVELAPDMAAIRALRREVRGDEQPVRRGQAPAKSAPHRRISLDGWEVLIGTSASGNAAVTFELAAPSDLWLHARGVPGAHVVLRGAEPPDAILERAAQLAAWHSAARASGRVEVDVAPRRYVRKVPNAPPGLVLYSNERTLRVIPRA